MRCNRKLCLSIGLGVLATLTIPALAAPHVARLLQRNPPGKHAKTQTIHPAKPAKSAKPAPPAAKKSATQPITQPPAGAKAAARARKSSSSSSSKPKPSASAPKPHH